MTQVPNDVGTRPYKSLEHLFKPMGEEKEKAKVRDTVLRRGSLIQFQYAYWKHDPHPLVIVTDMLWGFRIRGININYLTLSYINKIVKSYCGQPGFSYRFIKNIKLLRDSYRWYKWEGIRNIRYMDCDVILRSIDSFKSYDPTQAKSMREQAEEQLLRKIQPTAEEMTGGTRPATVPGTPPRPATTPGTPPTPIGGGG